MNPRLIESLDYYAREGRPVGSFLEACLENDLAMAAIRADEENLAALGDIALHVFHKLPAACHGSPEKVELWLERKRMEKEAVRRLESDLGALPGTLEQAVREAS